MRYDASLIYCFCYNPDEVNWLSTDGTSGKGSDARKIRGVTFMAAPKMWFGEGYNPILELKTIMGFKYSKPIQYDKNVYVELFELYDSSSLKENRKKQDEFWRFLTANRVLSSYEKNNSFNFLEWVRKKNK
ncbi:hypothetical protein [Chitinophaga sp. LS1]|uniref:hypothetical protein n=1 Tax=Chitinophaga sp. LS1 TaxID=3051176 RepID=UPI002AAAD1A9|nr:hypothetical protein [Chitinophaga sp. LS1]WPV64280.1 hypothetical protein QQL36_20985 [Chitinophaga sp. LS1]